jgi:hypothetical protein
MSTFYAYAYPEPEGFAVYSIQPSENYYSQLLRQFLLPYESVRRAVSPNEMELAFLQITYEAAANLAQWDKNSLEWSS